MGRSEMAARATIRRAEEKDFRSILKLARLIASAGDTFPWEGFYDGASEEDQEEQTAMLAETWLPDSGQCREAFVCELDDFAGIAGVYVLQPNGLGRCRHVAQGAYMVDPTLRSQGLGKQLCMHSVREAQKQQYTGMQFDMVVATNVAAIKAWRACGFKIMCTLPRVFEHPEEGFVDAHVMFNDFSSAESHGSQQAVTPGPDALTCPLDLQPTFNYATADSSYAVGDEVHIVPLPLLTTPSTLPASTPDDARGEFKVEPPLPDGLFLCPHTGAIQGTPTQPCPETTYRVTACASGTVTLKVTGTVSRASTATAEASGASGCIAINEDFAAHVENIVDVKQMPKEPLRTRAFGDWMIWMVHRAHLNDPTLIDFNFDGKHMPAPHLEPRIAPKLMKAMMSNSHIEVLSLSNANVQRSSALELAEALRHNCTLRTLNLEANCLDSNSIRELALGIKDNSGTRIEQFRLQHQREMGRVFGRPAEEAVGQMMQRNETILKFGFECDDAHWRNLIDRALVRNNDFSRRRSQAGSSDAQVLNDPIEEKTLGQLLLQEIPPATTSDFFSGDSKSHGLLRAYMAQNLQLPTFSQLQHYAKNSGDSIQYTAAAPLLRECRSWLLENALASEVSVVDAFGTTTAGSLKAWQENTIDLCTEAGERLTFKADREPAVFLSSVWTPWLNRAKPTASLAGA